jgi:hypothetical protein
MNGSPYEKQVATDERREVRKGTMAKNVTFDY